MKKDEISLQTKRLLAMSLKSFMQKKPFEKITIVEILNDCDITRSTFYYHFEDIFALLEWMFENEAVELLKMSEDIYTWEQGILLLLKYVEKNKKICLCAYNSLGRQAMERMFYKDAEQILRGFVNVLLTDIPAVPEHVEFIISFYVRAYVSCLANWLDSGMEKKPEEMVEFIRIAGYENIKRALERSTETK